LTSLWEAMGFWIASTHGSRGSTIKLLNPPASSGQAIGTGPYTGYMAALIEAINVKRKMVFELENTPYACLDAEVNTPTARGGQTLVRLKVRNLLTSAVFEKTFKAQDKFKEPDLVYVDVSYLYTDDDGSHFLDQESFETLTLNEAMVGDGLDFLIEGALLQLRKFNGNPIGLQLPIFVELDVAETEPGVKGDSSSGSVTKVAKMETGLEIRVPLFIKQGEKVKIATETREFAGRA
jgi:elongation factor P